MDDLLYSVWEPRNLGAFRSLYIVEHPSPMNRYQCGDEQHPAVWLSPINHAGAPAHTWLTDLHTPALWLRITSFDQYAGALEAAWRLGGLSAVRDLIREVQRA